MTIEQWNKEHSGEKFGELTIIEDTGKRNKSRQRIVSARCSCGAITEADYSHIKNGHKQSCGCLRAYANTPDISNQKFGKLTPLYKKFDGINRIMYWVCQCDCGNICERTPVQLKQNINNSCGCERVYNKDGKIDIGQRFGKLVVLEKVNDEKGYRTRSLCQCDCGNQTIVSNSCLLSGHTKSCGCLRVEKAKEGFKDLTNQRFGKLVAIEKTEERDHCGRIFWNCKCDCGNMIKVISSDLTTGRRKSCGCLKSYGELQIQQFLLEKNINFRKEYSFNDLYDQGELRFDFAIFNEQGQLLGLIECQGEQHYDIFSKWNTDKLMKHDKMKADYCKKNNINLILIPYKTNYTFSEQELEDYILQLF